MSKNKPRSLSGADLQEKDAALDPHAHDALDAQAEAEHADGCEREELTREMQEYAAEQNTKKRTKEDNL